MWKSFTYKDFDWILSRSGDGDQPTLLEIKVKGLRGQPMCISTKQVAHLLLMHLMLHFTHTYFRMYFSFFSCLGHFTFFAK